MSTLAPAQQAAQGAAQQLAAHAARLALDHVLYQTVVLAAARAGTAEQPFPDHAAGAAQQPTVSRAAGRRRAGAAGATGSGTPARALGQLLVGRRSEEHTSELQSP